MAPSSISQKEIAWLLKEKYHGTETAEFRADVKRLKKGEPLAYVIGWVDFLGCRIDIAARLPHERGQARSLIPRPETEFWVEQAISQIRINYPVSTDRTIHGSLKRRKKIETQNSKKKILDLFAGSGCIGIALAKHFPDAMMDLGEKDPTLCEQIKKNLVFNHIAHSHTRVIETNVFSNIADTYDYIFANPPYIDPTKKETVQSSVLEYEPHEALFAGENGLALIKQLLVEAPEYLRQGGLLYVEFGEKQKGAIAALAKDNGWNIEFQKDQFKRWRVAKLTLL